ncbi:hypothetical protein [Bacillus sp. FJAT-44742]|uniref:hypothetical protein n=1 Tax=Bacillus sp. FJAT-44742 TaxID=2014005 RepID=UPI000C247C35|nr:hypothetical protein [Bacillus sp. FJAT-44742]
MKKRDFQRQHIENTLRDMPEIRDSRSKAEIYSLIKKKQSKEVRKKKWLMPATAFTVACTVFLLLFPSLLSEMFQSVSSDNQEAGLVRSGDSQVNPSIDERMPMEKGKSEHFFAEDFSAERADDESALTMGGEKYTPALQQQDLKNNETTITTPYMDPGAQFIIPLTFIVKDDQTEEEAIIHLANDYAREELGLDPVFSEDILWESTADKVMEAHFLKDAQGLSSLESQMLFTGMIESFRYNPVEKVLFYQNGHKGVSIGNYGLIEEFEVSESNRGYYAYETETGYQLLVSGNSIQAPVYNEDNELLSFKETIKAMEEYEETGETDSVIPEGVSVEEVIEGNSEVTIKLSEESVLPEEEDTMMMIDAFLLTANDFNYEAVRIEHNVSEYGKIYNLNEQLPAAIAPNVIGYHR